MARFFTHFSALVLSLMLASCGGGGGGGDDFPRASGAASVSMDVSPRSIDVGDRMIVEVRIAEPHPDGINLKVRFPDSVGYVIDTAKLVVDDDTIRIQPGVRVTEAGMSYLVFYLPNSSFGEDEGATLTFELQGESRDSEVKIAVDPDVGSDVEPFDPKNPEFESEDDIEVEVSG